MILSSGVFAKPVPLSRLAGMLLPECTPLLRSDPRTIGRYRIVGRLGTGGMATVYLADADGYVAVKLVHEHLAADAEFRVRFERETRLAARVPAHCTAELLDTGVHQDRPYLVTEYLAGTPLHRLVKTELGTPTAAPW